MKTGADISHHQRTFDAKRYKDSGEDFIILKATEGTQFTSRTFASRWRDAGARNLPRGAYHFARPGGAVNPQADHFIEVVQAAGFRAGDAWALDLERVEGRGAAQLVDWADKWIARVRAALGGIGLFYASTGFITGQLGSPDHVPGGALTWVARYNSTVRTPWQGLRRPAAFPDPPAVWQRTDGKLGRAKRVASIGLCDFNEMTDTAFAALFKGGAAGFAAFVEPDDITTDELLDALRSKEGQEILRAAVGPAVRHELRVATGPNDGSVPASTYFDSLRKDVSDIKASIVQP